MGENWGSYGSWRNCPAYEYVTSFDLRIQGKQSGYLADDLAMTGMRIRCEDGTVLTSRSAPKGSYRGYSEECSSGFTRANVRIQSHQVRAYDVVKIRCLGFVASKAVFPGALHLRHATETGYIIDLLDRTLANVSARDLSD